MAFSRRVWGAGKVLVLGSALLATYFAFFAAAMRVALRAREVPVPDLTGRSVNQATALLGDLDLALHVEEARRPHPRIARGLVAAQDPPRGVVTRRARTVKVWLSDGPASAVVPALVGESERTALLRAEAASLKVERVSEIRSNDYPVGVVIAQWPPPDTRGASVALLVNRGETGRWFIMPDLIGLAGARAADLLRTQGFRVAVVGTHPYPGIPPGIVIRQQPPAGFQVTPGEPISLEVSR